MTNLLPSLIFNGTIHLSVKYIGISPSRERPFNENAIMDLLAVAAAPTLFLCKLRHIDQKQVCQTRK